MGTAGDDAAGLWCMTVSSSCGGGPSCLECPRSQSKVANGWDSKLVRPVPAVAAVAAKPGGGCIGDPSVWNPGKVEGSIWHGIPTEPVPGHAAGEALAWSD